MVTLTRSHLFSSWRADSQGLCQTRIQVISISDNTPMIGRVLISAVESLVIDYSSGRIGIIPSKSDKARVPVSRPPRIPGYMFPIIREESGVSFPVARNHITDSIFHLLSQEPRMNEDGLNCWYLAGDTRDVDSYISTRFSSELVVTDKLEFVFKTDGVTEISISNNVVVICTN